jgi:hypothetical protein
MGLLEFLFERRNRKPVGDIEFAGGKPGNPDWLPLRVVLSGAALVAFFYTTFQWTSDLIVRAEIVFVVLAYLAAGYWIRPRPDYSNLGIAGTPIDHPFRWSDDANRILVFLLVLFWPGRFIAETGVDIWRFLRSLSNGTREP